MARRSTDLLEVFNHSQGGGGSRKKKSGKRPKKPAKKRSKGPGFLSGFEGISLAPRQVLLVSCVLVLMVVLAFTVGLGVGRKGAPAGSGTALSRNASPADSTARAYIRGRVPRRSLLDGAEVDPDRFKADLVRLHGLRASDIRVMEGERGHFYVYYGPFSSTERARQVIREHNLGYLSVQGMYPFTLEEVVELRR